MNKELQAFLRIEKSSKRYKGRKDDLDAVFTAIRNCETERSLRINLEKINYGLNREIEKNENKLKALAVIKEKELLSVFQVNKNRKCFVVFTGKYGFENKTEVEISQEEFDLLKEVL